MHPSLLLISTLSLFLRPRHLGSSCSANLQHHNLCFQAPQSHQPAIYQEIPHAPNLHPSQSSRSSQPSQSSQPSSAYAGFQKRNLGMEQLKELMVETKRNSGDGNEGQKKRSDGGEGEEEVEGDHATYVLGSPVSFPARGGQDGRDVA